MFETYYYIDEEKIDCYLSDFSRHTKIKNKKLSVDISLPFIKVSSSGEFSKDLSLLSARQKIILLESILDNNEFSLYFDLSSPEVEPLTITNNTFIKFSCGIKVPEMVDMINGIGSLLTGKFGDFAQEHIDLGTEEDSSKILSKLFSEKQISVPIITINENKSISEINIDNLFDCDDLDFWDEVAEDCEIIAKVTKNCYIETKTKVVDLGKTYFGLSRAIRRQITNYENDPQYNIFEENVNFKIEVLAIRK